MAVTRVADIAEYLAGRTKVYDAAFEADLRRLRAAHGSSTVIDALRLLDQHADQAHDHKEAVRDGVAQTLTSFARPRSP
jgi:N-formylglutamate amidohydrolase